MLHKYTNLISLFKDSIEPIENIIENDYLFLLTNKAGILIAQQGIINRRNDNVFSSFRIGMSLSEKSSGTNAISLAMKLDKPISLLSHQHFSKFLRTFNCYSLPLAINNETFSYLMVSCIKNIIKPEIIAITQLIKEGIIQNYSFENNNLILNKKQKLILKLLAQGMTTNAIAFDLKISDNTVKYHKKRIFKILNAQNSGEAIAKAIRYQIIKP